MTLKEGVKHDAQKRRFSLFPTRTLYAIVDVLEYGARKYTQPISHRPCEALSKLADYCTCPSNTAQPNVILNGVTLQKGFAPPATRRNIPKPNEPAVTPIGSSFAEASVASVTTGSSKRMILRTPNGSSRITKTGGESTARTSKRGLSRTIASRVSELRHAVMGGSGNSPPSDSPLTTNCGSSKNSTGFAQSASNLRNEKFSTSTTTTSQDSFVDSSAGDATKDSDSWETVSKALLAHSSTCHVRAVLSVSNEALWRSGAGNWRHLENLRTRYYDAALRHINDWWLGTRNDEESGHHHLAHAACCLVFLLAVDLEENQSR